MLIPFKSVPFPRRRQHNLYSRAAGELGSSIEVSTGILSPSHSLFQLFTSRQPSWKQPANKPSYPVAIYGFWGETGERRLGSRWCARRIMGRSEEKRTFYRKQLPWNAWKLLPLSYGVSKNNIPHFKWAFVKKFQSFDLKVKLWAY